MHFFTFRTSKQTHRLYGRSIAGYKVTASYWLIADLGTVTLKTVTAAMIVNEANELFRCEEDLS